ncbi:MAG: hypothetical protein IJ192_05475, partial [Clostridia bacterium]|nr:hypothetical protein [Clostridia bacterium]
NNFDPVKNTTDTTNNAYYPRFAMIGTGLGSYNENYGTFDFIPNSEDTNKMIYLRIVPCGAAFTNGTNYNANNLSHCVNYSDIYVDTSEAEGCLYDLWIAGLGINNNASYSFSDNINLGDISFKGYIHNSLNIRTLGQCFKSVSNCVNLGNVNIDESSVITGTTSIYDLHCSNNTTNLLKEENLMLGWYNGCDMPGDTIGTEFSEFFSKLNKTIRYGQKNISGEFKAALYVRAVNLNTPASVSSAERIYNNGEINLNDIYMSSGNKDFQVYGISQGSSFSNCINNAPITMKNVRLNGNSIIRASAAGKNNLNKADIDISNTVTVGYTTYVEAFNSLYTAEHCENRGNIKIQACRNAQVLGVDYIVSNNDSEWYISGLSQRSHSCINFGNITVSEVNRCNIGGISGENISASNSLNYGDISCSNSGGYIRMGGIS